MEFSWVDKGCSPPFMEEEWFMVMFEEWFWMGFEEIVF
jgi:hypothetical protein